MSQDKLRRPRFRFSLRTLFVVVTVGCLVMSWLVYHLNCKHERHEALKRIPFPEHAIPGYPPFHFPIGLRLLGEEEVNAIALTVVKTDRERAMLPGVHSLKEAHRIKALFPEAYVFWHDPPDLE